MIRKPMMTAVMAFLLPFVAYAADPQSCPANVGLAAWATGTQPPLGFASACLVCDPQVYVSGLLAGNGVSCAAALSDLTVQMKAYAKGVCLETTGLSFCSLQVFPTGNCQTNGGLFTQIGYGYFHCRDIIC